MQIFSLKNDYKQIENIYLHDSELETILVDYKNKEIKVLLKTARINEVPSKLVEFIFDKVNNFLCPMNEPWGSGFYLQSVTVEKTTNDFFRTTFSLNSGDEIFCEAELVKTNDSLFD